MTTWSFSIIVKHQNPKPFKSGPTKFEHKHEEKAETLMVKLQGSRNQSF